MNKEIIKIIIQVLLYALGLIGASLGVFALTSCSASHQINGFGKTVIVTNDTTVISHSGTFKIR